ncbi:hypothetical protein [Pseudomonas lactis]|uniref:hypothetical protein n=1 Tax=Pseudomonas lactis TaxID=1615674 RepID=UPI00054B62CB|nr:hypothetical protein [Pseudomonas lactis]
MTDTNKMRDEFEREWGQVDSAQGVHFIPELNTYGSELYAQHEYAQMKSSAWFYFQKGWKASREALVIELPDEDGMQGHLWAPDVVAAMEAAGVKVKS